MTIRDAVRAVQNILDEEELEPQERAKLITYLDMGQKEIATVARVRRRVTLTERLADGGYPLPDSFYRVGLVLTDGRVTGGYTLEPTPAGWLLRLPQGGGNPTVEYDAYPASITSATDELQPLELPVEAQTALLYFAAAQFCLADEGGGRFASFDAQYQRRMQNLGEPRAAVVQGGGYFGI